MTIGINPSETLKMLLVTIIDQVTLAVTKYHFFDISANVLQKFLLDGLDPDRRYKIQWLMIDTSGNANGSGTMSFIKSTPPLDETPPVIVDALIVERVDTTVTMHLEVSEQLSRLRVRYRVVGSTEWIEEEKIPLSLVFDISLAGLLAGASYEYQYLIEDSSGNQTLTEWERM